MENRKTHEDLESYLRCFCFERFNQLCKEIEDFSKLPSEYMSVLEPERKSFSFLLTVLYRARVITFAEYEGFIAVVDPEVYNSVMLVVEYKKRIKEAKGNAPVQCEEK